MRYEEQLSKFFLYKTYSIRFITVSLLLHPENFLHQLQSYFSSLEEVCDWRNLD